MKRMTDDEWIAAARSRMAGDPEHWDIAPDLAAADAPADTASAVKCPYCAEPPALARLPRYGGATAELLFCPQCYGIWAPANALSMGLDGGDTHPAFTAVQAPPRCHACLGYLKPDGVCAKCGWTRPPMNCPQCAAPMQRRQEHGVTIDECPACKATWFDTGEIAAVYGAPPSESSLVESAVAQRAAEGRMMNRGLNGWGRGYGPGDMVLNAGLRALLHLFG